MSFVGPAEFIWGFFSLLFPIGVIVAVVLLVRRGSESSRSAVSILEERYARGEISEDEFRERKAVLREKRV